MFCTDPVTGQQFETQGECLPGDEPVGPISEEVEQTLQSYQPEATTDPGVLAEREEAMRMYAQSSTFEKELAESQSPRQKEIDARRAARDARVDEYGIEKPPASALEVLTDVAAPPEIMNAPETPWYEKVGRSALAIPAALYGHAMDEISPVDTRGDWKLPFPIIGELAHASREEDYKRARRAREAQLQQAAEEQEPQVGPVAEP